MKLPVFPRIVPALCRLPIVLTIGLSLLAACARQPEPDRADAALKNLIPLLQLTGIAQCVNPSSGNLAPGLTWPQQSSLCQCLSSNLRARYSVPELAALADDSTHAAEPKYLSRFLSLSGQCISQLTDEVGNPPPPAATTTSSIPKQMVIAATVLGLCEVLAPQKSSSLKDNYLGACSCAAVSLAPQIDPSRIDWTVGDRPSRLGPIIGMILSETGQCWERQLGL